MIPLPASRLIVSLVVLLSSVGTAVAFVPTDFETDVRRATVWRNGSKPGRLIARVVIPAESAGLLDPSGGIELSVIDDADLDVRISFSASECTVTGDRAQCVKRPRPGKRQRVKLAPYLRPDARGGLKVSILLQDLDIVDEMEGPVMVGISDGVHTGVGTSPSCRGGRFRLHCR